MIQRQNKSYKKSLNGIESNVFEWNGMQRNGTEWNGMEWNGMEWNLPEWNPVLGSVGHREARGEEGA